MLTADAAKEHFVSLIHFVFPSATPESAVYNLAAFGVILFTAMSAFYLVRLTFGLYILRLIKHSQTDWDDALHNHGFFTRLSHLVPALLIFLITPIIMAEKSILTAVMIKLSIIYMMIVALGAVFAVLNTVEDWYNHSNFANRAPITGFVQVTKLLLAILFILLSISLIIERSPLILLSGLTALAAVLMLIFRDTILGFVAGIQIAANRMFNMGDWIQVDKFGVDGEILEIGLTNVKVRNWDNTISTLPTYSLTNESIKNWRGMTQSGGRRIKRAILIDIHSIRLCNKEMLQRFSKIRFISDYIEKKVDELKQYHHDQSIDEADLLNSRKMTNIGTFRAYLEAYLRKHPKINQSLVLMVRQLPPNEFGLPLEVYCFCEDKAWVNYEKIQADIFDHILAMMPQFDLRAYQRDTFTPMHVMPGLQDQEEPKESNES